MLTDEEIEDGLDALVNCTVTLENAEAAADVSKALWELTQDERLALFHRTAGWRWTEMGRKFGLTPNGAKKRYTEALKHLKETINGSTRPARPDVQRQDHPGSAA
jgi:DNA-directed RNA polymerase specialized sigma24 family protein